MIDELVTITLDKERTLRLTLKGMLEYQRLTGENLLKGFRIDPESMEQCAALAYACLLGEDKELTYDDVITLIDIDNFADVLVAVQKCLSVSVGILKEKKKNLPLVKKPQAG